MKIQIIKVGKPAHAAYEELAEMFAKRLKPIWKIEEHIVRAAGSERAGKELQSKLGMSGDPHQAVVVLDERGKDLTSPELAQFIQSKMDLGHTKSLTFVIGGPYGISDELRQQADFVWRLSKGVFPSDLAWVMVWEQIYRAASILRGTPYHHE
ncbi:MAG TPA: 23S rRNA (pseudouridine(1915)-N(3))-methyltransferase RlmH [Oligoflexus sp.]|uniref:23S rRNA (pseudouridine(1915)-N(3))-methyltransferase RlmH n=1 Tax=Oligoflexus sp. TaxID=1971216 RepID=UPI002D2D9D3D|nr:23S rRNA (pseudouridine(1915)-N(3))-methyltransferase RlmH [Oligoflexus sp.]HYX39306.1 23S rRNA (pseudouridine(1915)-N(3))-methyltransferase RlmH [Oligoflexus sp.]